MRKTAVSAACMAIVLLLCSFVMPSRTEASKLLRVSITETTPVFMNDKKVAVFNKGTHHMIMKESDRFYHTMIGKDEVKFSKKRAVIQREDTASLKTLSPVKAVTKKLTPIMPSTAKNAKSIGQLQANTVVHLQRAKGDFYPVNFGGKTAYIHKNYVTVDPGIPVLMYHDLTTADWNGNVSVLEFSKFKQQMAYLHAHHYTTITAAQLEQYVKGAIDLPEKSVLITFDDGYESTVNLAYPVLQKYGFTATSFLITSRIGREGFVTEDTIRETTDVFDYQSHTHLFHSHNSKTNLSLLESESFYAITDDLLTAKAAIQDILYDHSVTALAYPYGKRSRQTVQALKETNISVAFTIDEGNVHRGDPVYELQRQRVHSYMTIADFADKLNGR